MDVREAGENLTYIASDETSQRVTEEHIHRIDRGAKVYSDDVTILGADGGDPLEEPKEEEDTTGVVD